MYLDNAATTALSPKVKEFIIQILDTYYNPSSSYQKGAEAKKIITDARNSVSNFINGKPENIIFTSSGSASNTLVIKGLTSENPLLNEYVVLYSPTAHKSMVGASKSCISHLPLKVNNFGEIDLLSLNEMLLENRKLKPLICIEIGNSEIGTVNNIVEICKIAHRYNGIVVADATGYIPTYKVDMRILNDIDFLTFSGHKLHALKGTGVLYINKNIELEPLIYGSQENGKFAGTENIIGIASLGKAVEEYNYSSISSKNRDYVYDYIINNIPESFLVGAPLEKRLPHNLYICFKGIQGESLMTLLDINDYQVSTGSACNSGSQSPSPTLVAIGLDKKYINSCIRISFSGDETKDELNSFCIKLKDCVEILRNLRK